jgi:hypothetical protein
MGTFLKVVAVIYLLCIWGLFFLITGSVRESQLLPGFSFFIAIGLSVPAALLYAFGQIADDVRAMRNDMSKMASGIGPSTGQRENVTAVVSAQTPGSTVSGESEQDIEKMYPVEVGGIRYRAEKNGKIYRWTRAGGEKVYPDWRSFFDGNPEASKAPSVNDLLPAGTTIYVAGGVRLAVLPDGSVLTRSADGSRDISYPSVEAYRGERKDREHWNTIVRY